MRVAHNSLATFKLVALLFPIKLEFRSVGFVDGGKPENPEEKTFGAKRTNYNKLKCI